MFLQGLQYIIIVSLASSHLGHDTDYIQVRNTVQLVNSLYHEHDHIHNSPGCIDYEHNHINSLTHIH